MTNLLTSLYAFLLVFMNSQQTMYTLPHNTPGDKYAAVNVQYYPEYNKTVAVWVRYYVWGDMDNKNVPYNITPVGGQAWVYPGRLTLDQVKTDGRERADKVIDVSAQ